MVALHLAQSSSFGFPGCPHAAQPSALLGVEAPAAGVLRPAFLISAAIPPSKEVENGNPIAALVTYDLNAAHSLTSSNPPRLCPRPHPHNGSLAISNDSGTFSSLTYSHSSPSLCFHPLHRSTAVGRNAFHSGTSSSVVVVLTLCTVSFNSIRAFWNGFCTTNSLESGRTHASATKVCAVRSILIALTKMIVWTPSLPVSLSWKTVGLPLFVLSMKRKKLYMLSLRSQSGGLERPGI